MPQVLSPELEMQCLQLMLKLRALQSDPSVTACEAFRRKLRLALLVSPSADESAEEVTSLLRRYTKKLAKLDETAEEERREKKRRRTEAGGSRFVDLEAGEGGDDGEDDAEGGEEE